MNRKKRRFNVLAIGAHPDDLEFGCGAALCRFVQQGHTVNMMVMTDGSAGGEPKIRQDEQVRSFRLIGARQLFWGGFEDTRLPFYENVINAIEKVVKKTKPDYVFVHFGKDTHQDHRHVSVCTVAATRNVPNVLFYEGPTTYDFNPNVFIDIRSTLSQKFRSLSCHSSQTMRTNVAHQSIVEIASATATFRGTQCRIPHAEAFYSLRIILEP